MLSKAHFVTSISPDCFEFDEDDEVEELPPVSEWIRDYAAYAGPKLLHPTTDTVKGALQIDFPELAASNLDLNSLLEAVGIHVIADHDDYRIAWFGTTKKDEVDVLLTKYQQAPYSHIRKKLGIDHLWILNLSPYLGYMRNDIFEADVDFSLIKNKPECAVIDL
jgi:hypothetical protein